MYIVHSSSDFRPCDVGVHLHSKRGFSQSVITWRCAPPLLFMCSLLAPPFNTRPGPSQLIGQTNYSLLVASTAQLRASLLHAKTQHRLECLHMRNGGQCSPMLPRLKILLAKALLRHIHCSCSMVMAQSHAYQ